MKSDRCQKNCCQSGSCSMSSFMEAVNADKRQECNTSLKDEGQARAGSLPEIASLVELTLIGSMTREQAILAADPYSIGNILRDSETFFGESHDLGAPERLLAWSDEVRRLKVVAENVSYPLEQPDRLNGTSGLMLLREDSWLESGHLKELYEEWALQYTSGRYHTLVHPSIALRERLMYRWKGHMETMLHHLDEGMLSIALVSGREMPDADSLEAIQLTDLRDIQLEALLRASLTCYRQGMDHRLEILIPYPADLEEWSHMHDWIEKVAEETLCHQRRAVTYSIGALLRADASTHLAADLARCADLLVLDCKGKVEAEERPEEIYERLQTLAGCIRKAKPNVLLRVSGLTLPSDLPVLYRMNADEAGLEHESMPAFRLAAAQWELREEGRSPKASKVLPLK